MLPHDVRPYLDKQLDWDNCGVEKDVNAIAHDMLEWEEKLTTGLEMTPTEIHDIKADQKDSAALQR
jgi:hypothetical protein